MNHQSATHAALRDPEQSGLQKPLSGELRLPAVMHATQAGVAGETAERAVNPSNNTKLAI